MLWRLERLEVIFVSCTSDRDGALADNLARSSLQTEPVSDEQIYPDHGSANDDRVIFLQALPD